jgi:hypothetical protein
MKENYKEGTLGEAIQSASKMINHFYPVVGILEGKTKGGAVSGVMA